MSVYCGNCGYSNAENVTACPVCGVSASGEPHISDVIGGNVALCDACGAVSARDSKYCRVCGAKISAAVGSPAGGVASEVSPPPVYSELDLAPLPEMPGAGESLLERLDRMESELEAKKREAPPERQDSPGAADKLDEREETLNNIAFKLDVLIADLLDAEAREYAFPDLPSSGEGAFSMNDADVKKKKGRSAQEIAVLAVLIAAIFLVGMTFGLWGSYFWGI
jgi:RNA polymerase subunit RPABC4/transcription elongation factor Spt4